ncbi:MAG: BsuPI-related putative proteinase inhibitor [Bacteroidota bacterium]|nr:BsuPI-related putative proteinase inhibitor [Candidatus Kapabacteria bacterium]MCS7302499.1 BsuPI-related putative proteinase inhibitor [Candidatus Kapabacteria bacterium]MCX7937276.1 BsuPI-related putative proteinase inhibitor [Chlorobiota bacterium]MDW8075539.1 BsuPI-related putative proteinase inhibitor [Bacteroidota bacterium]MDW8271783.1 BsuPI-related putative proteinase inhibitor [Bacteroidota bacterium]
MRFGWVGVLTGVCVLIGCRGASGVLSGQPEVPPPPVAPVRFVEFRNGGLNVEIQFRTLRDTTSPLHHFVFGITAIDATLAIRGRAHYDTTLSLPVVNATTGFQEKRDTIITEAFARWSNPLGVPLDTVHCRFDIIMMDGKRYQTAFDTVLALPDDSTRPFITVAPFIDAQTDSSVTFALLAVRHRGYGEDYHPTSERLRVQIFDEQGRLRFSSNTGMDFLQEISAVQPKRGEIKRFTFEWPGTDDEGNPLPPGRYTAVLSLVAKPYPYTARISFEWKGGRQ